MIIETLKFSIKSIVEEEFLTIPENSFIINTFIKDDSIYIILNTTNANKYPITLEIIYSYDNSRTLDTHKYVNTSIIDGKNCHILINHNIFMPNYKNIYVQVDSDTNQNLVNTCANEKCFVHINVLQNGNPVEICKIIIERTQDNSMLFVYAHDNNEDNSEVIRKPIPIYED